MVKFVRSAWYLTLLVGTLRSTGIAQTAPASRVTVQSRITQQVDDRRLVSLPRNTHPLARPEFDQGLAPGDLPLDRMLLVLKRSPAQDAALKQLLEEQQDRSSPNYHKWLTPQQFGEQFGPSAHDIQVVTSWLHSHGFQVARVATARTLIEFSGTARLVEESFHTPIHKFVINGKEHWANTNDQQLPAALAPVVAGIATLHNFQSKPQLHISGQSFTAKYEAGSQPQVTAPNGMHALSPADFAVIYNMPDIAAGGWRRSPSWHARISTSRISSISAMYSDCRISTCKSQLTVQIQAISKAAMKRKLSSTPPGQALYSQPGE